MTAARIKNERHVKDLDFEAVYPLYNQMSTKSPGREFF
jgi:hypothetical protein